MGGGGVEDAELHIGSFRVQYDGTARRVQQRSRTAGNQATASSDPPKGRETNLYPDSVPVDVNSMSPSEDVSVCESDCSLDSAMQDYLDNISHDGLCVLTHVQVYMFVTVSNQGVCCIASFGKQLNLSLALTCRPDSCLRATARSSANVCTSRGTYMQGNRSTLLESLQTSSTCG